VGQRLVMDYFHGPNGTNGCSLRALTGSIPSPNSCNSGPGPQTPTPTMYDGFFYYCADIHNALGNTMSFHRPTISRDIIDCAALTLSQ
jgi:hypothetical protein